MSVITEMLERLHAERGRSWNEQKTLLEEIRKREDKTPSAEERAKLARTDEVLDDLDKEIKEYQAREKREAEADAARGEWEKVVRPDVTDRRDNQRDAQLRAFLRGETRSLDIDISRAAREMRAIRAGASGAEFRDLAKAAAATGGDLVPTTLERTLYQYLEASNGVLKTNVRVITTTSGENIDFPKVTAFGTAAIVGEGTAFAEADAAFGKTTIGAYKYAQLVQVSNELIADSGVDVLGFVGEDAGRALGRVTDTAYVSGSGTNAPGGILVRCGTATTIQTVATGVPSYANLVDTIYSVNDSYRSNGAQWMMNDSFAGVIRKLADTTGRPLWEFSLQLGQPDVLLGYPVITDPNFGAVGTAASTVMGFGDMSGYYVRIAGGVRFERSDEFAFSSDMVTFRAAIRTSADLVDLKGCFKKVLEPTT